MLHPSIPAWVMVPIAPHNLSNRPIVLSDAQEVTIEVVGGRGDASANFRHAVLKSLQHGDRILVTRADHSVHFLHPKGLELLRHPAQKLGWNEGGV
jgi:NAD+ kinase